MSETVACVLFRVDPALPVFLPDQVTFVVQYFADHGRLVSFTRLPSAWRLGWAPLVSFYPSLFRAVQVRTVTLHIWVLNRKQIDSALI